MSDAAAPGEPPRIVVLDTNVVLDLLLFDDPRAQSLKAELQRGRVEWHATQAMREELVRVLDYPNIVAWSVKRGHDPAVVGVDVLARFDAGTHIVDAALTAPLLCSDPDDQCFIDLAWAHGAELISSDRAVIDAWQRLAAGRARR